MPTVRLHSPTAKKAGHSAVASPEHDSVSNIGQPDSVKTPTKNTITYVMYEALHFIVSFCKQCSCSDAVAYVSKDLK